MASLIIDKKIVNLLTKRNGHFKFESGYHSDLWLELDPLFLRPDLLRPLINELAKRLSAYQMEAICGPLVGGAFLAQMIAMELGIEFYYAERFVDSQKQGLFPVEYKIPQMLRSLVMGKRIAVVDDVISAGSAVRGAVADLKACGAEPVVLGTFLAFGSGPIRFATEERLPLESLSSLSNGLWLPSECPLCQADIPVEDITNDKIKKQETNS